LKVFWNGELVRKQIKFYSVDDEQIARSAGSNTAFNYLLNFGANVAVRTAAVFAPIEAPKSTI